MSKVTRIAGAAIAAAAIGFTVAGPAAAVPVRNVQVVDANATDQVYIGATVYSPPSAANCGAWYAIRVTDSAGNVRLSRIGRLNVCRGVAGSYTTGTISQRFNVAAMPVGRYLVCVAGSQYVNGRQSIHGICRYRSI